LPAPRLPKGLAGRYYWATVFILMAGSTQDDGKVGSAARAATAEALRGKSGMTSSFVESCVEAAADSAVAVVKGSRHRPHARKLLQVLKERRNILVTAHEHPDPDALASSFALARLLQIKLKEARISVSVKGRIGAGYNAVFIQQAEMKPLEMKPLPWDDARLSEFDAIVLLDVQPTSKLNPLPPGVQPTAVIDHHRSRGRRPAYPFCDIRTDVGASSSIVFSYFMELDVSISRELAAMLLFAIETDLAGAAGQPGELDNLALSSLTLMAEPRRLNKMRYAPLPQGMFNAYADGLDNALYYEQAMMTHAGAIESAETPAVVADFLLRFDRIEWVLVTAIGGQTLVLSLRTGSSKGSAADVMRRLVRGIGEGGGHRTKAGGGIPLESGSPAEIERIRATLRRRLLRALKIKMQRGQKLVTR
jgi:nanoRNase/pAp phosphatase (c-di-AMP/oligoRNAs hydrolase)